MNQPIAGYRNLSPEEVALINDIKAQAEHTRELVGRVQRFCVDRDRLPLAPGEAPHSTVTEPLRWAGIGMTDLQKGYMSLVRAVAAPGTF